jgi:arylsulfatase A-like enzyme
VLRQADANAAMAIEAVDRLREAGDDVLLVVGSDHGHHTVVGVVDVEAELIAAGLKENRWSSDVVSVSSGTAALIYVHPDRTDRLSALGDFLGGCKWAGRVFPPDRLADVGQGARDGLAFAVSMRAADDANEYGVPGSSLEALPIDGKAHHLGFGQHGGLGIYEQSPFLMIQGVEFAESVRRTDATSVVDIAPTILRHLGLPAADMDGRPLQRTKSR